MISPTPHRTLPNRKDAMYLKDAEMGALDGGSERLSNFPKITELGSTAQRNSNPSLLN